MKLGAIVAAVVFAVVPSLGQSQANRSAVISGRVSDVDYPLPGASVTAQPMDDGPSVTAKTDVDGRYRLSDLAPGEYRLLISMQNYVTRIVEHADLRQSVTVNPIVDVAPMCDCINWAQPSFASGHLGGRVTDPRGRPWAGALISLTGPPVPQEYRRSLMEWPSIESDLEGRFDFGPFLPVGNYRLRVTAPGFEIADFAIDISPDEIANARIMLTRRAPFNRTTGPAPGRRLLVETATGALVVELPENVSAAGAEFVADIDDHRLDHSWGCCVDDDAWIRARSQQRMRIWRWQLAAPTDGAPGVVVTPSDRPNEPVRLRLVDDSAPPSESFFRRIQAVSR